MMTRLLCYFSGFMCLVYIDEVKVGEKSGCRGNPIVVCEGCIVSRLKSLCKIA